MEKHCKESRRRFIFGTALTVAGVVSGFPFSNKLLAELVVLDDKKKVLGLTPSIWVEITKENYVVVTVARSEIGQGVRTTFAMIVAEELDADWSRVIAINAEGDSKYGDQSTGGSTSVRTFWTTLRQAGAQARQLLINAAAEIWGISPDNCYTQNSYVYEKNGVRKLSYGELIDKAIQLPIPPANSVKLKKVSDFKILGKPQKNIDETSFVTGKAVFSSDYRLEGMKYAVILRCPYIGGSLASFDDSEAKKIKGVVGVYQISEGIAVVAENSWLALKGRDALKVTWNKGTNAELSTEQIFNKFYSLIGNLPDLPGNTTKKIECTYEVPFLAHSTMEPMSAFAYFHNGKCEIWAGTQNPQTARSQVATALGITQSNVKANVLFSGGGFGRRHNNDYIVMAAKISKLSGFPIMFFYTKADDIKNDYYRPASVHSIKAGIDANGNPTGFIHKVISQGDVSFVSPSYNLGVVQNSTASYGFGIRTGPWRSVDYTQNIFVIESVVDELAYLAGKDPLQFRLSLASDEKLKTVLRRVGENYGWGRELPEGWGRGIAAFVGYGAYIAHIVEVSVSKEGFLKIQKIYAVVDPGFPINPENIKNQIMGAAIDALSTAINTEITIQNGQIQQSGFHNYRWLRMNEVPEFNIEILTTSDRPSGMGEVGFPSVTPALCNAIFNATGIRIRKLPIGKTPLLKVDGKENKTKDLEFNAYPNPFETKVTLNIRTNDIKSSNLIVRIFDILGKLVFESKLNFNGTSYQTQLDFEDLPASVYYVVFELNNQIFSFPILKKN
ncbi:MAG: molybdopterin-dependent oxidoreductase [Ignavibacteria bacterium]|nr:molybdopterin-dependent oxidoreductase [Ignavibacteria bacterium]